MATQRVVVSSSVEPHYAERLGTLARQGERTRSAELRRALRQYLALHEIERDDDEHEREGNA